MKIGLGGEDTAHTVVKGKRGEKGVCAYVLERGAYPGLQVPVI